MSPTLDYSSGYWWRRGLKWRFVCAWGAAESGDQDNNFAADLSLSLSLSLSLGQKNLVWTGSCLSWFAGILHSLPHRSSIIHSTTTHALSLARSPHLIFAACISLSLSLSLSLYSLLSIFSHFLWQMIESCVALHIHIIWGAWEQNAGLGPWCSREENDEYSVDFCKGFEMLTNYFTSRTWLLVVILFSLYRSM